MRIQSGEHGKRPAQRPTAYLQFLTQASFPGQPALPTSAAQALQYNFLRLHD